MGSSSYNFHGFEHGTKIWSHSFYSFLRQWTWAFMREDQLGCFRLLSCWKTQQLYFGFLLFCERIHMEDNNYGSYHVSMFVPSYHVCFLIKMHQIMFFACFFVLVFLWMMQTLDKSLRHCSLIWFQQVFNFRTIQDRKWSEATVVMVITRGWGLANLIWLEGLNAVVIWIIHDS